MDEDIRFLERAIKILETYEQPMFQDTCRCIIRTLRHMRELSSCMAVRDSIEETIMHVASFIPHSGSTEIAHLKQRRLLARKIRAYVNAANQDACQNEKPL